MSPTLTQKKPLGPKKSKKTTQKIESKSNVKIERTIENKSCSTTLVDPKTVFEPYPDYKKADQGQKSQKLLQN